MQPSICFWVFATAMLISGCAAHLAGAVAGPNANWSFDEGSGTTAVDQSGNGHTGSLINGPVHVQGRSGHGTALSFDNVDDHVLAGSLTLEMNQPFTISAWIKLTASNNVSTIASKGNAQFFTSASSGTGYVGPLSFQMQTASGYQTITSSAHLPDRQWTHVVVVKSGNNAGDTRLFINGARDDNGAMIGTPVADTSPVVVGARRNSTGQISNSFRGMIDDVALYQRALSGAEVVLLFDSESPRPDVRAPRIGMVQTRFATSFGVLVTWFTDETSDTRVEYGTTTSYGQSFSVPETTTFHRAQLSDLIASTTYHYRVISTDAGGNRAASGDHQFVTQGNAPPAANPTGQDYVVSPHGGDGNPGTIAQPFQTIRKGVQSLSPGDILHVRQGVYNENISTGVYAIPSGTSWNQAITIRSYPGERPVLQPHITTSYGTVVYLASAQFIVIDGLVLDAMYDAAYNHDLPAVKITDSAHHIRLANCEIMNSLNSQGVQTSGGGSGRGDYVEVINSDIHDNGAMNIGTQNHGLYIETSHNLFDGLRVYNNDTWGFHFYDGVIDGNIVRNSMIWGNGGGIILAEDNGNAFYNNLIFSNAGVGIDVRNYQAIDGTKIYNNTIVDNQGGGIRVGSEGSAQITNTEICNNLISVSDTATSINSGIFIGVGTMNAQVRNNLSSVFFLGGSAAPLVDIASGTTISGNLVSRGGLDLRYRGAVPDCYPLVGSPAIDAALGVSGMTEDFAGVPRPQGAALDIGAFERIGASGAQAGTLAFSTASFAHPEGDSGVLEVTISVTRTGGADGPIGVSYTTSNGTATAGSDYTAAHGTLGWSNGDTAVKTYTVLISGDYAVESDEDIELSLSDPTGGATLGADSATLTIISDDLVAVSPTIVTEPSSQTVVATAPASFHVVAAGTPTLAYQWKSAPSGSSTYTAIIGATLAQLSIASTSAEMNGMQYRCTVSNSAGLATTTVATLTVSEIGGGGSGGGNTGGGGGGCGLGSALGFLGFLVVWLRCGQPKRTRSRLSHGG